MAAPADEVEARVFALLEAGEAHDAAIACVRGYGPAVLGYLARLLERDDARLVFERWAEDVWRGLPGFRRDRRLRAWAYLLASREAARFRREPTDPGRPPPGGPAASAPRPAGDRADDEVELSWERIVERLRGAGKRRP